MNRPARMLSDTERLAAILLSRSDPADNLDMAAKLRGICARGVSRAIAPALATALGAFIAGPAPTALAAPPEAAQRTVVLFNFDEPSNPDPVPPHWKRAQHNPGGGFLRPGYPAHNLAELEHDQTLVRSGIASVRLPTRGGSTTLRLDAGQVPVFADADYAVEAHVRTTDLRDARAFVVARLLDQRQAPIQGSEVRSRPILSAGAWTPVSLTLPGRFADAAWLQIDLELLQPRQYEPEPTGALARHKVWTEDISGAAWFDDVGVYQIPRATLRTLAGPAPSPLNIITAPQSPALVMSVRDLAGEPLQATVSVRDLDDRQVAQHSGALDPGARPTTWTPELPGFGWYRAVMDVSAENSPVSRAEVWFVYLPPRTPEAPRSLADAARLGLLACNYPESRLPDLVHIADAARAGFFYLPAFDPDAPRDQIDSLTRARAPIIEGLLGRAVAITLAFSRVPGDIASTMIVDADDPITLIERDPAGESGWLACLTPTLNVFGQRLLRYQLGGAGAPHALRRDPAGPLTDFERAIARLVPAPVISISWGAESVPPSFQRTASGDTFAAGPLVDAVTLTYPAGFPPDALESLARDWGWLPPASASDAGTTGVSAPRGIDGALPGVPAEITLVPTLPDGAKFGRRAPVIELVKRAVYFWKSFNPDDGAPGSLSSPNLPRLGLLSPWILESPSATHQSFWPSPELAVMRTLAAQLPGRRVLAPFPAPAGVRAFVLAGRDSRNTLDRGCVVAWNESAEPSDARIELASLGGSLTVTDPFGNRTSLSAGAANATAAGPLISVPLDTTPVFIEGVDSYLALFAASLRLEPGFLPASVDEHELRLILSNPWPVRISGQLQLKEAVTDGTQGRAWNISPRGVVDFVISPGETTSIPVTLSFGAGQIAGPKDFVVLARVLADRQYPPLRLKTRVEVGLPALDLRPEVSFEGSDVFVVAGVTNHDTRPRTLRLETSVRGMPSQQLQISDLPPGQKIYRRFVFKNAAQTLSGKRIVLSLSDIEAAERLNRAVLVP